MDHASCVVLWGHNPNTAFLAQAWKTAKAKARGAALVVIDPRHAGPAVKADQWLRVRPGTDGALALALAGVMISEGWYDRTFIQGWSNGAFLVRLDEQRLVTAAELGLGNSHHAVVWDTNTEKHSGIAYYHEVGHLAVGLRPDGAEDYVARLHAVAQELGGVVYETYAPAALRERFPALASPLRPAPSQQSQQQPQRRRRAVAA